MKVLVTGGAGYIGSITTRHLLNEGHEVLVLDSLIRGRAEAVDSRASFVAGEVGDDAVLDKVLPGCDAVLHIAGLAEVAESQRLPGMYFDANVAQPLRLLESMCRHDVRAIVFSSTAAVYGEPETVPILEDSPTRPINVYGRTKLVFEQMLDAYSSAHAIRSVRFRYFNVAGAWPDGTLGEAHEPETHLIPRILRAIHQGQGRFEIFGDDYPTHDGTCVRDYIHVCDLAHAHHLGLRHLESGGVGGVFNLGNGRGYSNLEVARVCADITGDDLDIAIGPRRVGDPAVLVASPQRATDILGWRQDRGGLETMIEDAWRWHSSQRNPIAAGSQD